MTAAIEDTARELATTGQAIGARCRVAPVDPDTTDGYLYAVLNHRGEAMVLAHDAFDAATWFQRIETAEEWEEWVDDARPTMRLPSDTELAEAETARRRAVEATSHRAVMIDLKRQWEADRLVAACAALAGTA